MNDHLCEALVYQQVSFPTFFFLFSSQQHVALVAACWQHFLLNAVMCATGGVPSSCCTSPFNITYWTDLFWADLNWFIFLVCFLDILSHCPSPDYSPNHPALGVRADSGVLQEWDACLRWEPEQRRHLYAGRGAQENYVVSWWFWEHQEAQTVHASTVPQGVCVCVILISWYENYTFLVYKHTFSIILNREMQKSVTWRRCNMLFVSPSLWPISGV